MFEPKPDRSRNEHLKEASRFLRGTLEESLARMETGAVTDDDTQLTKFHGTYQQDDRDLRAERMRKKMEKAFIFMVRVRVPGGVTTPAQWLALDKICEDYGNGTLRLTTRQSFQLHGIIKSNLKRTMQAINACLLDTIAACGDVNRNVMCSPNPYRSALHAETYELARQVGTYLLPRSRAYHEIWLDGEKVVDTSGPADDRDGEEPIYGRFYLPRKFKIVFAVPPSNDVDVFGHDLGFIAIIEDGRIVGYDITAGGGMGMTHGRVETYPRAGDVMAFCTPDQVMDVSEKVMTVQRDFGDRVDRHHARFKYTVQDLGLDFIREETERRLGYKLAAARPFRFEDQGDRYGWHQGDDGNWHYTVFVHDPLLLAERGYT
jgi:sulfite reductase (NADPH) hemoprotein beta-component